VTIFENVKNVRMLKNRTVVIFRQITSISNNVVYESNESFTTGKQCLFYYIWLQKTIVIH